MPGQGEGLRSQAMTLKEGIAPLGGVDVGFIQELLDLIIGVIDYVDAAVEELDDIRNKGGA